MSEIPEDVVEIAMRIVASQKAEPFTLLEKISKAIMARDERAAKIAADYECDITQDSMMGAPFAIAKAIRTQEN